MAESSINGETESSAPFDGVEEASKEYDGHLTEQLKEHMDNYDVIFRDIKPHKRSKHHQQKSSLQSSVTHEDDDRANRSNRHPQPANTCRILQRKLELKVERAKRIYSQYQEESCKKSQAANLIPINCLSIPENLEKKPLVDYKSEESDDAEEISFFSKVNKKQRLPELSDTFSIQDMTIESDGESDDSGLQNLELLPPTTKTNFIDKFLNCFNCKCLWL